MNDLIKTQGKKVSPKKRTHIFLNINVSCVATSMLATALTTALPPIMKDLNMSVNTAQWLTSGFILFLAVMTPFTAYLISRFRTKRLYCIAILFFIGGLTICACSTHFWMMMLGRIIQGCGNGLMSSMAQVIILTIYPPDKIGTMMGWYGLSIGVAPIISPTLAGILVDTVGWRMIFIISIAIMAVSLICAIFVFEDVLPIMRKKFDVVSLILSAFAFGGVTLAVGNMGTYKFVSFQVLFALIVGLITGVIFARRQLRIKVPFLDIRVLKNKDYTISLIATVIIQLTFLGSVLLFPVYVQQIKGKNATISGLVTFPGSLVLAIISPFAGTLYDKFGMKLLFIVGSIIATLSNVALYFIRMRHSIWIFAFINLFRCIGFGSLMMPLVTWAMKDIPKIKASDATALYNAIRFIGGAVGSALFISIMTKVANGPGRNKENPQLYGINVVFLIMAVLCFIMLLLGIFGCKQGVIKKSNENDGKDAKDVEMKSKETSDIDVVVINKEKDITDKKEHSPQESESGTVIDNNSSSDNNSNKEKSDIETINDNEIVSKTTSEIDVIVNDDKKH